MSAVTLRAGHRLQVEPAPLPCDATGGQRPSSPRLRPGHGAGVAPDLSWSSLRGNGHGGGGVGQAGGSPGGPSSSSSGPAPPGAYQSDVTLTSQKHHFHSRVTPPVAHSSSPRRRPGHGAGVAPDLSWVPWRWNGHGGGGVGQAGGPPGVYSSGRSRAGVALDPSWARGAGTARAGVVLARPAAYQVAPAPAAYVVMQAMHRGKSKVFVEDSTTRRKP